MRFAARSLALFSALCCAVVLSAGAQVPRVVDGPNGGQLLLHDQPFLILGGELANSSAGTNAQADTVLPRLAKLHVNTVLMPVAWEQTEPTEGRFDYSILDHWTEVARENHIHLVLLWFGSWKNAFSNYAPAWVKRDTKRFPRSISADGTELEILSPLGGETLKSDSRAFENLMTHVRERDAAQQTILMVQVENEVGYLGRGRDRSAEANRLFNGAVPEALLHSLQANTASLSPELARNFNYHGHTWREAFGDAADEVFTAWSYASFIQKVAEAGKRSYPLPMYVNAQLPALLERAGEYPSGGPHPYYLAVYRAAGSAIDFYSPDIYWPNFEYWIDRYKVPGNPIFVPEARIEAAPYNAFYAYGEAKAFGFSAFNIDSIDPATDHAGVPPAISQTYGALDDLKDLLVPAEASGKTRGLVLHADSPRATQTIAIGGYLMDATLSRSWPAKTLLENDGAMIVLQSGADEFYVAGSGLTVDFTRDPDVDDKKAGIASIEEVSRVEGQWVTQRRLNGDESNQGRQLSLSPNQVHIYRVSLYSTERVRSADGR